MSAKDGLISSLQAEIAELEQRLSEISLDCKQHQSQVEQLVKDKQEVDAELAARVSDAELVRTKSEQERERLTAECAEQARELLLLRQRQVAVNELKETLAQTKDKCSLLKKESDW